MKEFTVKVSRSDIVSELNAGTVLIKIPDSQHYEEFSGKRVRCKKADFDFSSNSKFALLKYNTNSKFRVIDRASDVTGLPEGYDNLVIGASEIEWLFGKRKCSRNKWKTIQIKEDCVVGFADKSMQIKLSNGQIIWVPNKWIKFCDTGRICIKYKSDSVFRVVHEAYKMISADKLEQIIKCQCKEKEPA